VVVSSPSPKGMISQSASNGMGEHRSFEKNMSEGGGESETPPGKLYGEFRLEGGVNSKKIAPFALIYRD